MSRRSVGCVEGSTSSTPLPSTATTRSAGAQVHRKCSPVGFHFGPNSGGWTTSVSNISDDDMTYDMI
jgi:hypothetical protein